MAKHTSRIGDDDVMHDVDITTPDTSHALHRVFDYLWPDSPSQTAAAPRTAENEEIAADGLVLRCSLHSILAEQVVYRIAVGFFNSVPIPDLET